MHACTLRINLTWPCLWHVEEVLDSSVLSRGGISAISEEDRYLLEKSRHFIMVHTDDMKWATLRLITASLSPLTPLLLYLYIQMRTTQNVRNKAYPTQR